MAARAKLEHILDIISNDLTWIFYNIGGYLQGGSLEILQSDWTNWHGLQKKL